MILLKKTDFSHLTFFFKILKSASRFVQKFFTCFSCMQISNKSMLRKLYITIFIFLMADCQPGFKRSPSQYSGIFGIISAVFLASSNSVSAKIVTTDFMSGDNVSPVIISKSQKLGIFMDKEMSTNCQISINSIVQTADVSLSPEKKEIFFTPSSSGWPVNLDAVSYINFANCKDAYGSSVAASGNGAPVFIADGVIYLDGTNGLDTYTGFTTGDPLLTLSAALAAVTSKCTGACAILMKGGVYPVSSSVNVPTNVSLIGGYDPSDWKKRRADKTSLAPYDTIIDDLSSNVTGNINDPYATIKYSNYTGTKEKSVLDGIMVYSPFNVTAANYSTPIAVVNLQSGSGVSIRNVITLDRSNTASTITSGFYAVGSAGTISLSKSSFTASNAGNTSVERHGVVYTNSAGTASFYIGDSTVNAGNSSANNSTGVLLTGTVNGTVLVENNSITAGFCLAASCVSSGITANFATANGMTIKGNTITSGAASGNSFSYGIYHIAGSGLTISGNNITSGTASGTPAESYGIKSTANGATLSISSNTIVSGSSNQHSKGIFVSGSPNTVSISANTVTAGSATGTGSGDSIGIESAIAAGLTNIDGNTVTSTLCSAPNCYVGGIKNSSTPTILITNNKVTSGSCSASNCFNRILDLAGGTATTVSGNILTGSSGGGHSTGIEANSGNFTIDSNTVTGASCTQASCFTRGLSVSSGGSISVTKNNITAGPCQGAGCNQKGLVLAASATSVTINENIIDSGAPSANTSSRIAFDLVNWPNNSDIQRNTFINRNGAGDPVVIDITSRSTSARICSNVIIGGGSTNASAPMSAVRTSVNAGGLSIMGNTIIAPVLNANTASGVNFSSGGAYSNFKLDQNIIYGHPSYTGSTTCIKESAAVTYNTLVRNNVSNCNNLYDDNNGTLRNYICTSGGPIGNFDGSSTSCGNQLTGVSAIDNTNLNPVFVNFAGNDFHLDASTPAGIRTVIAAGDIAAFSTACGNVLDRDGNTRTAGTSIGAYK